MKNPTSFKIDEKLIEAAHLPDLSDEVKEQLTEKIRTEGAKEPLTVWKEKGLIIDGVARYRIYQGLKLTDYPVREMSFASVDEAVNWRIDQNLHRRHLNRWQRCLVVMSMLEAADPRGKEAKSAGGKRARGKVCSEMEQT